MLLGDEHEAVGMALARVSEGNPADLLGLIERLAGELSLAEEPARFIAALESPEPPGAAT